MSPILCGLDRIDTISSILKDGRVGLMTNPTGINGQYESGIDILHRVCSLSALFAVEHGIRGDIQAGAAVDTFTDKETGLTVYSAYGKNSRFNE